MNKDEALKIAEKLTMLLKNQISENIKYFDDDSQLIKLFPDINELTKFTFAVDDWNVIIKCEELKNDTRNENIWIIFNLEKLNYDIYIFTNESLIKVGAPCPLCGFRLNPDDLTIRCKKCGHTNEHHDVMFNCDNCHAELDKVECPNCHNEFTGMLLLGNYTYKVGQIEPFNIPPVDNNDAALFMKHLSGDEDFSFTWDEKPKAMMIYELKYSYPKQSYLHGWLLSVSIDLWEHELNIGRHSTMEPYLKEFVIGTITIKFDGDSSRINISAKPLKL